MIQETKIGSAYAVVVPEAIQRLGRELNKPEHAELCDQLNETSETFEDVIAGLAAHFNIVLDGLYSGDALLRLCDILISRLRNEAAPVILLPSYNKVIQ